jgi:hypothetical protein
VVATPSSHFSNALKTGRGEKSPNPSSRFEPLNPLTRRDATLSPTGGEGRVRGRSGGGEVTPKVFRKWLEINKTTFIRSGGPKGWGIHGEGKAKKSSGAKNAETSKTGGEVDI